MKNPMMPFAAIMAGGIILVFVIAVYGALEGGGDHGEKAKKDQKQEQKKGETSKSGNDKAKEIFEDNCASCHGKNLEGKNGPELDHIGKKLSKGDVKKQIKNGGGGMPAGVIKGDKADKVAEWLSKKK